MLTVAVVTNTHGASTIRADNTIVSSTARSAKVRQTARRKLNGQDTVTFCRLYKQRHLLSDGTQPQPRDANSFSVTKGINPV